MNGGTRSCDCGARNPQGEVLPGTSFDCIRTSMWRRGRAKNGRRTQKNNPEMPAEEKFLVLKTSSGVTRRLVFKLGWRGKRSMCQEYFEFPSQEGGRRWPSRPGVTPDGETRKRSCIDGEELTSIDLPVLQCPVKHLEDGNEAIQSIGRDYTAQVGEPPCNGGPGRKFGNIDDQTAMKTCETLG